jgi:sugar lactone lactonase YvrE
MHHRMVFLAPRPPSRSTPCSSQKETATVMLGGIKTFADGMAVDNDDRVYVATGGGIEVLSPQGEHLGIIPVRCPPADCQNIAFSGPTKQTLYIGGAGSLYKVEMIARGLTTRAK